MCSATSEKPEDRGEPITSVTFSMSTTGIQYMVCYSLKSNLLPSMCRAKFVNLRILSISNMCQLAWPGQMVLRLISLSKSTAAMGYYLIGHLTFFDMTVLWCVYYYQHPPS